MKYLPLTLAELSGLFLPVSAHATPTNDPDQIATSQRIRQLEQRLLEQEQLLQKNTESAQSLLGSKIRVGSVLEIDAISNEGFDGESTSDIRVATAGLGIGASVNDQVSAEITFLYEEDETDLEIDAATVRYHLSDQNFYFEAGQIYLPFGSYETNLVSKPLALLMAETRETALLAGYASDAISANVFVFNGDIDIDGKDQVDTWGASVSYTYESEPFSVIAHAGYMNNLAESGGLQDAVSTQNFDDASAGVVAGIGLHAEPFHAVTEVVQTLDAFDPVVLGFNGKGAEPSVWNIEFAYAFAVAGKHSMVAFGYQATEESLELEMPESRFSAAWKVDLKEATSLSFEWLTDADYKSVDGGTGEDANTFKARLAVEF